ncbi:MULTISPECIES: DUF3078 domain-containing protein [unclassified Parabacteroides]|uniref:DUF3078 domain-containing protein n=1 Tax=unclassified Parabacteroides TaxID=2649774 RepID=UPI002474539E|nr:MULTISPECIES: DUF3078 domain-containing protein [unclassified Parabacteroides]MDH6324247.1 hypothetical protein [Parabacteroides sp. PH5-8]MDH6347812.1 hypothetical protein [Parabacteroides sp. PH5-46]MDH6394789.1 hypothetical protein [Parabacteroides sp. PFB2-22]MDH6407826.1 hypothetical protein [Parabacteroides sp. PH5-26]
MKRLFIVMSLTLFAVVLYAQDEEYPDGTWVLKGVTGMNASQNSQTNWSAGGENTIGGNLYLNGSLTHKKSNWLWQSTLALNYGLSKTKSQGTTKASDNIALATQLGYTKNDKWFYTAMADFQTQFAKGYNYPDKDYYISNFMAPAYSTISLGIEYRPRPIYSLYLSPVAGKLTFVRDNYLSSLGSFGVDPGDKFKAEIGAYFKARAEQKVMENVQVVTTLDLFSAYNNSFGNIDVNWDVLISMKINKYLSATLNTTLKYDDDVKTFDDDGVQRGAKIQFKEVLGVGLAYNF